MHNFDITPLLEAISVGPHYENELSRIFHGRGHEHLNFLNLDYYHPYLFLISYHELTEQQMTAISEQVWQHAKQQSYQVDGLVFQYRAGQRTQSKVMFGDVPDEFTVNELGADYFVSLTKSQNTGIFPDMRLGREFVQSVSANAKVLNLFAYTCAFSVTARLAKADLVINMDMNKGVLKTGERNHQLNDVSDGVRFFPHDILKSFGKLKRFSPYDVVVVDPPSFQKGSFVLTKDYQKILRRLSQLGQSGSQFLLCANSPEMSEQAFKDLIAEHIGDEFEFVSRLGAPDGFAEHNSDKSLKALVYKQN